MDLLIDEKSNLLIKNSVYTVRQALCALKRINFIGSTSELQVITFQAGYLTYKNWQIILADKDGGNYGKLTEYYKEKNIFYWSLPEKTLINHKLVKDLQNINLTYFLFFQNKSNILLENLKIKLYNFIGLGIFEEIILSPSITVKYKVVI